MMVCVYIYIYGLYTIFKNNYFLMQNCMIQTSVSLLYLNGKNITMMKQSNLTVVNL